MIKILPEFQNEKTINEFNGYIKEFIDILEHGNPTKIMGKKHIAIDYKKDIYLDILDIIPSLLMQKTNIRNILENKKISLDEDFISDAIKKLMKNKIEKSDKNIYKYFFDNLKDSLNGKIRKYSFIFLLNLKIKNELIKDNINEFKEILNAFGLEIYNINDLNRISNKPSILTDDELKLSYMDEPIIITKIIDLFKNCSELIRIDIDARSLEYAHNLAISKIKTFLGYISFIKEIWKRTEYYGFAFDKFNLNNIDYGTIIIIVDEDLFWPNHIETCADVKNKIEIYQENIDKELFDLILQVYKDYIKDIKNDSFIHLLKMSFSMYYLACTEFKLEYSFLTFWSLSENMIKWKTSRTDDELIDIMKSFVNPYIGKRIEFIKMKRDKLVHRGETAKIYSGDRNISKLIADIFLNDAIIKMKGLKGKKDFHENIQRKI